MGGSAGRWRKRARGKARRQRAPRQQVRARWNCNRHNNEHCQSALFLPRASVKKPLTTQSRMIGCGVLESLARLRHQASWSEPTRHFHDLAANGAGGNLWETLEKLGKPRKTKVSQSFPKFPRFGQSQVFLLVGCAAQEPSARRGAKSDTPASELPRGCAWQITHVPLCWHHAGV